MRQAFQIAERGLDVHIGTQCRGTIFVPSARERCQPQENFLAFWREHVEGCLYCRVHRTVLRIERDAASLDSFLVRCQAFQHLRRAQRSRPRGHQFDSQRYAVEPCDELPHGVGISRRDLKIGASKLCPRHKHADRGRLHQRRNVVTLGLWKLRWPDILDQFVCQVQRLAHRGENENRLRTFQNRLDGDNFVDVTRLDAVQNDERWPAGRQMPVQRFRRSRGAGVGRHHGRRNLSERIALGGVHANKFDAMTARIEYAAAKFHRNPGLSDAR